MADAGFALTANEAELYIDQLKAFALKDVGSTTWLQQHEFVEKLNIQAHLSVASNTDEFVMDSLIVAQKLPILVHELVCIELWRQKVYPYLVKMDFAEKSSMTPYMVLYHEATLASLLEAVLYHEEACTALGDSVVDLVDYCMRAVTYLVAAAEELQQLEPTVPSTDAKALLEMTGQQQLEDQTRFLRMDICIKAVAMLRYLTDHVSKSLPLSCMTRLLNTHDAPAALAALIVNPPWSRFHNGKTQKYIEGKWQDVSAAERMRLSKTEAQVWLAFYNLLMDTECRKKYQFNTNNRIELLKVRGQFHEVLLDQLPMLGDLRRSLEELAVATPPDPSPSVVLEQMPEIREHLLRTNKGKFQAIAGFQLQHVFVVDEARMKAQAQQFAATYNFDALEALLPDNPKCALCGQPATNRCSRCQSEWYCRRQCQVEHWKKHKEACNLLKAGLEQQQKKN